MSQHRANLRFESLETRDLPAPFGNPWLDGRHITMSLAPDGADISGEASNLQEALNALGPTASMEILRAFQAWIANANINVGLVADGGQEFSAGGAFQGDGRFGDIRIGARELSSDVLAVTAPFNYFDSNSGNIVLNSAAPLDIGGGAGYDLFTIFLQEAGHAFGVGNSADLDSAMYEYYQQARLGLAPEDIAAIQQLYGARIPDSAEGPAGNNTLSTAASYSEPMEFDLTTAADIDCFKITTALLTSSITVRLRAAGLSLLTARVEILNASGQVVAGAVAADPTNNDVTVTLANAKGLSTYYVRIRAADGSAFNIGSYGLTIEQRTVLGSLLGVVNGLLSETGLNNTLGTATQLVQQATTLNGQVDYSTQSRLNSASDVDYFRIRAPQSADGDLVTMIAAVWGVESSNLDPRVQVLDAEGNVLAAQVLTNDDRTFSVQIEGAAPDADYYLRISSDAGRVGDYGLAADFRATPVLFDLNAAGVLSSSLPESAAHLTVAQNSLLHFVLTAGHVANWNGSLEMTIVDDNGVVLFRLTAPRGDARSANLVLAAGTYRVRVRVTGAMPPGSIAFNLRGSIITDPIGIQPADTTTTPGGGTTPGTGGDDTPPPTINTGWVAENPSDGSTWF